VFHALAPELRKVAWPNKVNPIPIDKYDKSSNPEEFIEVYHTVIEAAGGGDWVKARSWLVKLPERTIYNWNQLCAMFISIFQGTYERPSIAGTLKTIKQKHDESL
jgi:hypothetical protein